MLARRGAAHANSLDPVKTSHELYDTYDYASFTIATATTDYDVKANQSLLFKNVPKSSGIIIWADRDISIKFNDTSMPSISHEVVYSPHEWFDKILCTNLFITNVSGSIANIRIFIV